MSNESFRFGKGKRLTVAEIVEEMKDTRWPFVARIPTVNELHRGMCTCAMHCKNTCEPACCGRDATVVEFPRKDTDD